MTNQNTPEYLEKIKTQLFENLRMLPCAPGVQMQAIPEDGITIDNAEEEKDNPDERISIRASDKGVSKDNEFVGDSGDEREGGRRNLKKLLKRPSSNNVAADKSENSAPAAAKEKKGGTTPARKDVAQYTSTPATTRNYSYSDYKSDNPESALDYFNFMILKKLEFKFEKNQNLFPRPKLPVNGSTTPQHAKSPEEPICPMDIDPVDPEESTQPTSPVAVAAAATSAASCKISEIGNLTDQIRNLAFSKHSPKPVAVFRKIGNLQSKPTSKSQKQPPPASLTLEDFERGGVVEKISFPKDPRPFVKHNCSTSCAYQYTEEDTSPFRQFNPLVIPFYLGWRRTIVSNQAIIYVSPCGLPLRSYEAIHSYNLKSKTGIPLEFFSLEPSIGCFNSFRANHRIRFEEDISKGKEWTPVQCLNSFENDMPPELDYIIRCVVEKGVEINKREEFLVCCDCEDDCKDKNRCACWQLTLSFCEKEGKAGSKGYKYRRLMNAVDSGIYECNKGCKCNVSTCFNRVVQSKVNWPVQVFKTEKKGWGVRTLHDMPRGSFLCCYTGQLLNDAAATEEGVANGNQYLAELDFIEGREKKLGYESNCSDLSDTDESVQHQGSMAELQGGNREGRLAESSGAKKIPTDLEAPMHNNQLRRVTPEPIRYSDQRFEIKASKVDATTQTPRVPELDDTLQTNVMEAFETALPLSIRFSAISQNGEGGPAVLGNLMQSTTVFPNAGKSETKTIRKVKHLEGKSVTAPKTRGKVAAQWPMYQISLDFPERADKKLCEASSNIVSPIETQSKSANAPSPSSGNIDKSTMPFRYRKYFKEGKPYIIDGRKMGNFSRYFNHSCDPNVFIQNVFVDTHDLRFPWVALFTKKVVKAGTELCWDYGYEIGSVPGKTLDCFCGVENCRGRLL